MLTRSQIQFIQSLKQKKHRERSQCFVAEGSKLVMDLLRSAYTVHHLYALASWVDEYAEAASHVEVTVIPGHDMQRISGMATPGSVLAVVGMQRVPPYTVLPDDDITLMLDEIRDPGNLGTIIRIADWFGISLVVCSPGTVDLYNPKVVQGTMGSITRVQVRYEELPVFLANAPRHLPVYGLTTEGRDLFSEQPDPRGFIVVGNESHGLSAPIQPFITHSLSIPFYPENRKTHAESLNAAVAAGIVCATFRNKRAAI